MKEAAKNMGIDVATSVATAPLDMIPGGKAVGSVTRGGVKTGINDLLGDGATAGGKIGERAGADTAARAPKGTGTDRAVPSGPSTPPAANAAAFASNPVQFSEQHFINTANPVKPGTAMPPHPSGTTQNGANSVVNYELQGTGGPGNAMNLNITGRPGHGGTGESAYYVPFSNGQTNGVSVPAHPAPGQPTTVLTGGLTGCSFHAKPDPQNPNNFVFSHASQTSNGQGSVDIPQGGVGVSYRPQGSNPSYGPDNYPQGSVANSPINPNRPNDRNNAASAFAHYLPGATPDSQGQWNIMQQGAVFGSSNGRPNPNEAPTLHPVGADGSVGGLNVAQVPVPSPTTAAPPFQS